MSHTRALIVLLLVGCVFLAGCSGGISDNGSTPTEAIPTDDTPETPIESPSNQSESPVNGTVEVHNINVGQSVGTLIVGPTGETMLIDTGDFNDDGEHVLAYLQRHNIDRIDYLVVSHNDADHIGGNAAVIEYYETQADGIGAIYDPGIAASTNTYEEYLNAVEAHDVTLYETREGDTIPFEDVDVQVLGPPDPYLENKARNENSIVLRLQFGQTSFLWTGDAEDDQEAYLVEEYGTALNATIYKAGHHGSSSSSSEPLLDAVDPQAVIISSAYDSRYDHPHNEVLQRLADRSIPTYWTAIHGDIVLVTNGESISVRTQQAATTDSLALRTDESVSPSATTPVTERTQLGTGPAPTPTDRTDTEPADATLVIESIHADAAGDDRENLNDEFIVFRNEGDEPLDLTGWTVRDEADNTYEFPADFTLDPGASVTLHTGSGTDTDTDLYWDSGQPVWNNDGDMILVTNSTGTQVLSESYS